MTPEKIPADLRSLAQWVTWKYIQRDGKSTKCPFQATGLEAKSNDASTWATFDDALAAFGRGGYEGIGFMFSASDPYCGIDLDGCRDPTSGETQSWARGWLLKFASYCEVSPSGSGWKIFCRGKSKFETGKKHDLEGAAVGGKKPGVEIYDHLRWFAVTGLRGKFFEVADCQSQINEFCDAYWKPVSHRAQRMSLDGEVYERARRYVSKVAPAVSGQSGHNAAFTTACILVLGFGLTPEQAYPIFCEWNQTCVPPWNEREIWHKLNSANKQVGDRFYLRNVPESQQAGVRIPTYTAPDAPKTTAPPERELHFTTLHDAAKDYLATLGHGNQLIDLGIPELNYALGGGVERGEMVIFAARPSHGKSAFALQCLHQCAADDRECLMVSEEMGALAIGKRTVQFVSGVAEEHWQYDEQIVARQLEMHFSKRRPIHIVESCRTPAAVDAAIKRMVAKHGVSVVAVDYAQLLIGAGKGRYEQISNTSLALRQMANDHNVLLLVLCQLSRDIETRNKFMPKMTDLRDSGQLEQDADVIVFLVWPHRLNTKEDPHLYQIYVAKNRNRPINQPALTCRFEPSRQKFTEGEGPKYASRQPSYAHDFDQWSAPEF